MDPRPYKIDDLAPERASRRALHEMGVAYALLEFERRGEAPFMWLIAARSKVIWIETPWADDREKAMHCEFIREIMKTVGAHAYSHMIEAYMASTTTDPDDDPNFVMLSKRPKNERDEVLIINTFDRKGDGDHSRFLVTPRQRPLKNHLGPRIDEDIKMSGRMGNLLL